MRLKILPALAANYSGVIRSGPDIYRRIPDLRKSVRQSLFMVSADRLLLSLSRRHPVAYAQLHFLTIEEESL